MASAADGAASPAEADTAGMDEMVKWRASLLRDSPDADASAPPVGSDLRLHWLTDAELLRFLVAARGKPADAITRLEATLKWRADHVAPGSRCPECHLRPTSHCLVSLGLGESGRPVLYASPPRAESTDPDAAVAHVACELEKAFALPGAAAQWVWLVDMRGYTLWSSLANTRSGAQMASVFSAHYPERLGAVVLLEPPSVFGVLLSVSSLLDVTTVLCIHECPPHPKWRGCPHSRRLLRPAASCTSPDPHVLPSRVTALPSCPHRRPFARFWTPKLLRRFEVSMAPPMSKPLSRSSSPLRSERGWTRLCACRPSRGRCRLQRCCLQAHRRGLKRRSAGSCLVGNDLPRGKRVRLRGPASPKPQRV